MLTKISSEIEKRGPAQYRARFECFADNGVKALDQNKTLETRALAQEWISLNRGKVDAEEGA